MVIDFQSHLFPESYLGEIQRLDGNVVLEAPDPHSGLRYFYDKQLKCRINTATFHGQDPERRIEHMDQSGVDIQVLSVPPPGADRYDGSDAVALARKANDGIASLCSQYPRRFVGLCTLPTSSVAASLDELERSIGDLGLKGFGCYSNLNGRPLDSEGLFPLYERAAKLGIPIYLHPTAPLSTQATGLDIVPTLIYGWAFDATVAMTRLVYGRVLERFPEIDFVVADVGGVFAFFAQRPRNIYEGRTEEVRARHGLKENPLDSFKRFYVDTADHPPSTLRCALDFFGVDRLLFGTNYPYGPEEGCRFVRNSLDAIDGLGLTLEEREKVLGANAARVLRMSPHASPAGRGRALP